MRPSLLIALFTILGFAVACGDGSSAGDDLTPEQNLKQAQVLADQEKPDEAMKHLQSALDAEGAPAEVKTKAQFGAVVCQAKMGKGSGMNRWLDELEKANPAALDAKFYLGLAQTLLGKEEVATAGEVVARGEKKFPGEAAIYTKIKGDLEKVKNDAGALAALGYLGGSNDNPDWVDLSNYWN
ncbi:MAG: hypothetical protein RL885_08410 [Planctomycetota bacterium]